MFDEIPDMAAKRAELTPDRLAFADTTSGRDWSFRQINEAADATAAGLRAQGLAEGDRLAILCQNRAEFFVALFACQKTGIILCPLNWRQPALELTETIEQVGISLLLADTAFQDTAQKIAAQMDVPLLSIEKDLAGWIDADAPPVTQPIPAERPWYLLFTSGTTGLPKSVVQTARMAWANTVNIGQAIDMTSDDRAVCFLPLFHTAGINLYSLPVFLTGGASTILPKFDAAAVTELLASGQITQFFAVPAVYQELSLLRQIGGLDWSRIRCGCGGAPLPEPLIRFYGELGAKVLNGMGMTETGPTVFLMDPEHATQKIGSVGKPQSLAEVRLDSVPEGAEGVGELLLRGPGITPGYFANPEATAAAFTSDGWLATGDVARRDADGYYFIVDRIKDMFISGGENVYPAEVERVLHTHPAVLEAAVIGVPDAKWGEVGAAFLLLRPGATLAPDTLRPWCRDRLASYKVPAHARIVTDLPRTAAGKVCKPDLLKAFQHD
ncbi:Long-chain-fatty-acid--CoA ligase [Tritonibacter multivorans]|uniref:3-methylmercaptopropionyl-CoA ligase n=1 Tax=Tritonibacter multivorans TaxID=928856 RepID=A0A0P1FZJ1_9RHOB|nr:AMP-binding protein [Tritonibacter multivorans]MDA7422187.1 AMP-binding protein [Tritonibacter multivorans]CUH74768.1 Long-chain-fatty-acid--CoA ligase [Tritonibacter multivorans]SFD69362.1 fatty-acyl-CoA synthase [Tritonibacter multivorans]